MHAVEFIAFLTSRQKHIVMCIISDRDKKNTIYKNYNLKTNKIIMIHSISDLGTKNHVINHIAQLGAKESLQFIPFLRISNLRTKWTLNFRENIRKRFVFQLDVCNTWSKLNVLAKPRSRMHCRLIRKTNKNLIGKPV